jgi:hypothetical protein
MLSEMAEGLEEKYGLHREDHHWGKRVGHLAHEGADKAVEKGAEYFLDDVPGGKQLGKVAGESSGMLEGAVHAGEDAMARQTGFAEAGIVLQHVPEAQRQMLAAHAAGNLMGSMPSLHDVGDVG